MRYIDLPEFGSAEVMTISDGPQPDPAGNEVLIRVKAVGINRPDLIQREGNYPAPPGASPILGLEAAGEIVAVGREITQWRAGDLVCALCNGGAYAEYVAVPATQCLPVPKGLSLEEAASLPETYFTVWSNLFDAAGLAANQNVLIHGGSSGIGITAIQLAKAWGAQVWITAGSEEKCVACLELGADYAINYRQQDFVEVIKETTDGRGMDIILDMVGGEYIQKNIRSAAPGGRIINIAFLEGAKATVNFMPVMLKRLTLTGSTLRSQDTHFKAEIAEKLKTQVWPLFEAGKLRPVIHRQFAFSDVIAAHQLMESNQHIGKIVLKL